MSHYFITPAGHQRRHLLRANIWGRELGLISAPGVFSAHRLDLGTSVLFAKTTPPADRPMRILDIGCGFGAITTALALACPQARIDAIDTNELALALTAENAERHQVSDRVRVCVPDGLDEQYYDEIWSNPPIRIGKKQLHALLARWLPRLAAGGQAWLVVGKNLGADSLQRWLTAQGWQCTKHASAKGFRVLHIQRGHDEASTGEDYQRS